MNGVNVADFYGFRGKMARGLGSKGRTPVNFELAMSGSTAYWREDVMNMWVTSYYPYSYQIIFGYS